MWVIPTGTSSALKKKSGKESQYMFSHPETGSDPPIGSDRESGCDRCSVHDPFFQNKIFLSYLFFIGQSPKYSVDRLQLVLWLAFKKYCGQSPIRTFVNL